MTAPIILPITSPSFSQIDEGYDSVPVNSLLDSCLPFISDQNLRLISDDIHAYVLRPDKDIQNTDLFKCYPEAQFVLSTFRKVFRGKVAGYLKKGLIQPEQSLTPQWQNIFVHEIIQRLSILLYQRLTCYTAGLDTDLISALSATAYESKSLKGETIAILPSLKLLENNFVAKFSPPGMIILEQQNVSALRKQLNTSGTGALAVYKDKKLNVYKTVGLISEENSLKFPRFRFPKHNEWVFAVSDSMGSRDGRVRYCNGLLMLPLLNMEDIFKKKIESLSISDSNQKRICEIISATDSCRHGTILIIADEKIIEKETNRLISNKRGTRLDPSVSLTECGRSSPILEQFSAVDGAIFLDFEGRCHAFGVILDGVVQSEGNNARGSRYNSTKTYTEWVREVKYPGATILGVVKSEDGMLDFFDETKALNN